MRRLVAIYGIANDPKDLEKIIILGERLGYKVIPTSPFGKIKFMSEDIVIAFSMGSLALEKSLKKTTRRPRKVILLNPVQRLRIIPMRKKHDKGYESPNKWWLNIPILIWKLIWNHKYSRVKSLQNLDIYVAADDDLLIHHPQFWDNADVKVIAEEQHNSLASSKQVLDCLRILLS